MELSREQNWARRVSFVPLDFLRRLGWSNDAHSYSRLFDAFTRLTSVTITAKNAFYHPKSAHYVNGAFHLMERFVIAGEGPGRKALRSEGDPPTFFEWSETALQSIRDGNIRSIDLAFALSLDRPLALRLFRYLDKKRHGGRKVFEVGLRELCGVHLGMVIEGRYDSNLKASLEPAHAELVKRDFLVSVAYEKMKTRKGLKVVYTFVPGEAPLREDAPDCKDSTGQAQAEQLQLLLPDALPSAALPSLFAAQNAAQPEHSKETRSEETEPSAVPLSAPTLALRSAIVPELVARLNDAGVSPTVAQDLFQSFPPDQIALQLDCLGDREPKNPAATLVKAIKQGWTPPPEYFKRQEAAERAEKAQEAQEASQRVKVAQKATERQREASLQQEAAHLDALWEKLDAKTREGIEQEATERLGVLGRMGKAQAALTAMRRNLLRERLRQAANEPQMSTTSPTRG